MATSILTSSSIPLPVLVASRRATCTMCMTCTQTMFRVMMSNLSATSSVFWASRYTDSDCKVDKPLSAEGQQQWKKKQGYKPRQLRLIRQNALQNDTQSCRVCPSSRLEMKSDLRDAKHLGRQGLPSHLELHPKSPNTTAAITHRPPTAPRHIPQ
jgi:hypothetical protein